MTFAALTQAGRSASPRNFMVAEGHALPSMRVPLVFEAGLSPKRDSEAMHDWNENTATMSNKNHYQQALPHDACEHM